MVVQTRNSNDDVRHDQRKDSAREAVSGVLEEVDLPLEEFVARSVSVSPAGRRVGGAVERV